MINISVINNSICDECRDSLKESKEVFCSKCYEDLLQENLELKKELEKLNQLKRRLSKIDMCE